MSICHACGAQASTGARFCATCGAGLGAGVPYRGGKSAFFEYVPHPHIENRKQRAPRKLRAPARPGSSLGRFNNRLGVAITNAVGTMWCAYAFAVIACISLPEAVRGGSGTLVPWIAQTFLQLVLLSIIMVGQKVEATASENRAIDTYKDAEALLAEVMEIQKHLLAQDACLQRLIDTYPRT